eukprot:TRINITY_DN55285_c0_g1_i1.p1 TRINITY_DN55285_c0_g1~~TRINITY_DN55285_c0_g1_i1.p1  ORF type:complete len:504 (-),score=58.06 TRINITY_DN55285_c0_g1_i1:184-1695(-)
MKMLGLTFWCAVLFLLLCSTAERLPDEVGKRQAASDDLSVPTASKFMIISVSDESSADVAFSLIDVAVYLAAEKTDVFAFLALPSDRSSRGVDWDAHLRNSVKARSLKKCKSKSIRYPFSLQKVPMRFCLGSDVVLVVGRNEDVGVQKPLRLNQFKMRMAAAFKTFNMEDGVTILNDDSIGVPHMSHPVRVFSLASTFGIKKLRNLGLIFPRTLKESMPESVFVGPFFSSTEKCTGNLPKRVCVDISENSEAINRITLPKDDPEVSASEEQGEGFEESADVAEDSSESGAVEHQAIYQEATVQGVVAEESKLEAAEAPSMCPKTKVLTDSLDDRLAYYCSPDYFSEHGILGQAIQTGACGVVVHRCHMRLVQWALYHEVPQLCYMFDLEKHAHSTGNNFYASKGELTRAPLDVIISDHTQLSQLGLILNQKWSITEERVADRIVEMLNAIDCSGSGSCSNQTVMKQIDAYERIHELASNAFEHIYQAILHPTGSASKHKSGFQ